MTFEEDICPYRYPFSEDGQPRSSPALQHRHYRNERCCFEGWGFCMTMAISRHRLFVVGSLLDVMRPRLPHLLHPTLRQLRRSPFIYFFFSISVGRYVALTLGFDALSPSLYHYFSFFDRICLLPSLTQLHTHVGFLVLSSRLDISSILYLIKPFDFHFHWLYPLVISWIHL